MTFPVIENRVRKTVHIQAPYRWNEIESALERYNKPPKWIDFLSKAALTAYTSRFTASPGSQIMKLDVDDMQVRQVDIRKLSSNN